MLKQRYRVQLGKMLQPESSGPEDSLGQYLRAANIEWDNVNTDDVREMFFSPHEKEQFLLNTGDLLVSEGGDVGRAAVFTELTEPCYYQNAINRVRPIGNNSVRFLFYWLFLLKKIDYIDTLCNKATIAHLTADKLEQIPVPLPPPEIQVAIADYLDNKTSYVNQIIQAKRQQIEMLRELRLITITNAVTKGLNPSVELKESGIEWIGKIPKHWRIRRIKNLLAEKPQYGANEEAGETNPDWPRYVRITDIAPDGSLREETFNSLPPEVAKDYMLKSGDLLLARSGATVGKAFKYDSSWGECCYAGYLIKFAPNPKILLTDFLHFFTQSHAYNSWIQASFIQSTIQNVSAEKYVNLKIALPSVEEQNDILIRLQPKLDTMDSLIHNIENQLRLLEESRLIYIQNSVTGEISIGK